MSIINYLYYYILLYYLHLLSVSANFRNLVIGHTNKENYMEFTKLSSPSLKDLFIKEIENLILSGKLSIGDKLPSERELAEQMGVSRIVINSGLNELAKAGFIEQKPRIGAYVADYRRTGTVETLLSILRFNGGRTE